MCFSPVVFLCDPVIKLCFLQHIVRQGEKNGPATPWAVALDPELWRRGTISQRWNRDGNTMCSPSGILLLGAALLLEICACSCEQLYVYKYVHLDTDAHARTHIYTYTFCLVGT